MSTKRPSKVLFKTEEVSSYLDRCNCVVCGCEDQQIVFPATRTEFEKEALKREFSSSGGIPLCDQLVACPKCGLRYISPRLKSEIMISSYASGDDARFVGQNPARSRNFGIHLDKVKALNVLSKGHLRVFDVGSAGGAFLKTCKDRGFEVDGCEPSRWLCSWAKKEYDIDIRPGILADCLPLEPHYDLVTMWDVLEHVADPREVLLQISSLLQEDGILVLTFPDISRLIAKVLGRKWSYLSTVHLWYFTPETIRALLAECGYDTLGIMPYYHRLGIGYLFSRAKETIPILSIAERALRAVGMAHIEIPYWIGQSMVVAKYRGADGIA